MSSWILAIVIAAVGLAVLLGLTLRLVVVLRRFRAVSTAVGGRIGDRSGALGARAAEIRSVIQSRRASETNTEVTAADGIATVRH